MVARPLGALLALDGGGEGLVVTVAVVVHLRQVGGGVVVGGGRGRRRRRRRHEKGGERRRLGVGVGGLVPLGHQQLQLRRCLHAGRRGGGVGEASKKGSCLFFFSSLGE